MRIHVRLQQGFTLIELIVVFAIAAIMAAVLVTGLMNYVNYQRYVAAATEVVSVLKETRQRSIAAEGDTTHGVHFTATTTTVFSGASYTAGDPSNVTTDIKGATIVTNFTGGADAIVFGRKTATTSATGTVSVVSLSGNASTTITVSGTGMIE